jgi:hypothetical protein
VVTFKGPSGEKKKLAMNCLFSVTVPTLFIVMMTGCSSLSTDEARAPGKEDGEGLVTISVLPYECQANTKQSDDIAAVISADLQRSGRFRMLPQDQMLSMPTSIDGRVRQRLALQEGDVREPV